MMKRYKIKAAALMLISVLLLTPATTYAATFAPTLTETVAVNNGRDDNARPITNSGFLNCQGVAFDIYTCKDGYTFNKGTDGNKGIQVVHFNVNGNKITKKEYLKYAEKNIGHANDGTIFTIKGKKYMFVAISGGSEKYSKTFAGNNTKIGVIWMDEYNKKIAKVRGCSVKVQKGVKMQRSIADSAFSGITYTGMRKVGTVKRPVFVLKDGLQFYAAYLTVNSKRNITFTIFDRARINKPVITYNGKKYEAATQGVTYHNKYLYLTYSGEKSAVTNQNMLIGRITYSNLFKGTWKTAKNLQVCNKRYNTYNVAGTGSKPLAKHIPEAIFFRNLEATGPMYISVNRANKESRGSDIDYVQISKQNY